MTTEQKTYGLINWRDVEGILYADVKNPHEFMGLKAVKGGTLIQVFMPDAISVTVKFENGDDYKLFMEDKAGFFALFVRKKLEGLYKLEAKYENGKKYVCYDQYQFGLKTNQETNKNKYNAGNSHHAYKFMGAHKETRDKVSGVRFMLWAPNAESVSVVGDFNFHDSRRNIMSKDEKSGIFETFIPGLEAGEKYMYEIRKVNGDTYLKTDPFALATADNKGTCVVSPEKAYTWGDASYLKKREKLSDDKPLTIFGFDLQAWIDENDAGKDVGYKDIAAEVAAHVKKLCATHILINPVAVHLTQGEHSAKIVNQFAVASRGKNVTDANNDFKAFVDVMHKNDIGVIVEFVPSWFPRCGFGLENFDNTCLYEHLDPKKGINYWNNTSNYNYGRPEVRSYLKTIAYYLVDEFHADGLGMVSLAPMLYLDYNRAPGQWIPNIYGGNENLEAVDFIKKLNKSLHKNYKGFITIAEDASLMANVTGKDEQGNGLGFDYKWDVTLSRDFVRLFATKPIERKNIFNKIADTFLYAYNESFINSFPVRSLKNRLDEGLDLANMKSAYALFATKPSKKLVWDFYDEPDSPFGRFVSDINKLYKEHEAMHQLDLYENGFEWINSMDSYNCVLTYIRRSEEGETFIVACNLDNVEHENFRIGVPKAAKYKELINSDNQKYGGSGFTNPRVKASKNISWDGRRNSIAINLAPLSVSIIALKEDTKQVK